MTFGFGFCSVLGKTLVLVRFILAGFGFFPSLKATQSPTRRSAVRIAVRILVPDYDPLRTTPKSFALVRNAYQSTKHHRSLSTEVLLIILLHGFRTETRMRTRR